MVVALLALVFVLNPPTDAPLPALPDARAVTIMTLPQADDILVVPDAKHIPQEWWPALEAHMKQGGRTLLIGTDPFAARVRGGQTEEELFARLVKESRPWCDFSTWQRENERGPVPGKNLPPISIDNFRDWDALVLTNVPPAPGNTIVFHAAGDARTSLLAVIAAEEDGAHWHCVVPLATEKQSYVLHEAKFRYFYGGTNRGRLSLDRVKRLSIGLNMHLGAQLPGAHWFDITPLRVATDPRPVDQVVDWPDLPLISPPYRRYTLRRGVQASIPRARTCWVPIAPEAAMYFDATNRWAWIGMDRPSKKLIRKCLAALEEEPPPPPPLPPPPAPIREESLTVKEGRFYWKNRPLFLRGINYWPLNHNGIAPGERNPYWLEPEAFNLDIVRRDLNNLKKIGVNAVSIQYHEPSQAAALRWFVSECRRRGIWVHCFVGHLQPLYQDLAKARRLVEAAALPDLPGIFAIDVAWEPHLGPYPQRCRLDPDWENWIREQYGSVEHAETVIGRPLWNRDGFLTGPPDNELCADGLHTPAVRVYRRFVNDWMSRRYGEIRRFLRSLGCRQLLSARSGYGGSGSHWPDALLPIDLMSGAVHFDFISPEGYALTGDHDQFMEGGFITAYARGVSGGKPAVWLEFGNSVGTAPQAVDLANQARLYRNMYEMARRSRAAGIFGWWYPGGWRVDEHSDFGIFNLDGSPRPAAHVFRKMGRVGPPRAWTGRTIDPYAHATGLSGLWDDWRDIYRREMQDDQMEELRPAIAGAGAFNAEWGSAEVAGQDVPRTPGRKLVVKAGADLRLELINTGTETWTNVSVNDVAVTPLSYGERTWIAWTPATAGHYRLRARDESTGRFGEALDIEAQ